MIKKMGIHWHLRQLMAARGLFQTTELLAPLAERGVHLSREQVFRLVTQPPQRLSMDTLAALCDILQCDAGQLIEVQVVDQSVRRTGTSAGAASQAPAVRRTTIRRPDPS